MSGIVKPLFGTPLNRAHPLAQVLLGCWLFNEGSGNTAYDSSGCENHGTLINIADPPISTSGWGPGPHGGGLIFDGLGSYMNAGQADIYKMGITDFSIAIGINSADLTGSKAILSHSGPNNGYGILANNNGLRPYLRINSTTVRTFYPTKVIDNKLHNYVINYERNNNISLYVDGIIDGFIDISADSTIALSEGLLYIAYPQNYGNLSPLFTIHYLFIFMRSLLQQEITKLNFNPYYIFSIAGFPAWMTPGVSADNYYRRLLAGGY